MIPSAVDLNPPFVALRAALDDDRIRVSVSDFASFPTFDADSPKFS
jgi:hypothetical protein